MAHAGLAQLAALVGAAGTAAVLLSRHRLALVAGFALLAAAEVGLAAALVPASDLERLQRPSGVAAVAVALAAVCVAAYGLARRPELALPALLVAAPFRVPVQLGDQRAFLLVPLYATLAAASLAFLARWLLGMPVRAVPRALAATTAAFVAFAALSLLWSHDLRQGTIGLVFFVFPFMAGFALVARAPLPRWLPRTLGTIAVALAGVFTVIGIWQAATHTIFFAQDLRVANAYTAYFRVTSLFKDPSLFGRYLVFGFAVLAVALWYERVRPVVAAAAFALLFVGLYLSYSQSSMITMAAVVVGVTLVAGDRTARRAIAVGAAVALVVGSVFLAAAVLDHSARRATSGRSRLVTVTVRVIRAHPLAGVGLGAQPKASHDEAGARGAATRETSHTTPLTVAAELGIGGVLLYLAFLAAGVRTLWGAWRRDRAFGLALAAVFLVVFVHSLFYAGFFEDPLMFGTLALAAAVATAWPRAGATPSPEPAADDAAPALSVSGPRGG